MNEAEQLQEALDFIEEHMDIEYEFSSSTRVEEKQKLKQKAIETIERAIKLLENIK
jgi:hypothetical protein